MVMSRIPAMQLPWFGRDVPHAILDVGRGCDTVCPGCYNNRNGGFKTIVQLKADLNALRHQRRLQTISLTGGEPTLHPEIVEIVAMISRAGIKPALLTNGFHLKPDLLGKLRQAGLKAVLLHIQPSQRRADIPYDAPPSQWRRLRAEKAQMIHEYGIKAGLTWIGYRSQSIELTEVAEEVLDSPYLDYLLVTGCRDFRRFEQVTGSVDTGLRANPGTVGKIGTNHDEVTMADLQPLIEQLGFPPFGQVSSSKDSQTARWLTHLIAVTEARDGRKLRIGVRPGLSDRIFSRMLRMLTGRYVFLFTPSRWQFRIQLACNAVTGGNIANNCRVIIRSLAGHTLFDKHILLQEGPTLHSDGEIEFCDNCPDAVWQDNVLVPVCLADRMALAQHQTTK